GGRPRDADVRRVGEGDAGEGAAEVADPGGAGRGAVGDLDEVAAGGEEDVEGGRRLGVGGVGQAGEGDRFLVAVARRAVGVEDEVAGGGAGDGGRFMADRGARVAGERQVIDAAAGGEGGREVQDAAAVVHGERVVVARAVDGDAVDAADRPVERQGAVDGDLEVGAAADQPEGVGGAVLGGGEGEVHRGAGGVERLDAVVGDG